MRIKMIFAMLFFSISTIVEVATAQGIKFMHDFSPSEGIVKPQEAPYREEICLNGKWDFQPVSLPADWIPNRGIAPELALPEADKWEKTQIKIPSPWNVNEWGGGSHVGKDTDLPYAPSSVYFPGYPRNWASVRMGWLKKTFTVPDTWVGKRVILHFDAIMGEAEIRINGTKVNTHFGDYLPFELDVTRYVKFHQLNELLVGVKHRKLFDKTSEQYKYFRFTYPPGSNTDDLVGIWQDVFLLGESPVRIANAFIKPWVDRDELEFEVEMVNQTDQIQQVTLLGTVRAWINKAAADVVGAPEIAWELGKDDLLEVHSEKVVLNPGESKKNILKVKVAGRLKYWAPATPNLYTVQLKINKGKKILDCKTERFGWRQFTIRGKNFYLNGEKIQCFADIQHPFGAYVCSRRFAWAWYRMIKDFGGNAVRLHAQPWPKEYYDLADEMGLMVLDEGALFGSSLSLNLEEEITWQRTEKHIDELILRDRNHPSVIGWSLGNELFAIAMYNKPSKEVAERWDARIVKLTERPALLDPTRTFLTDDGDKDMNGHLPVWSKHFGHGLQLDQLPVIDKPLVVGESGATYYGKPKDLYQFVGDKAYKSYFGRNEALAVDVYQNVVRMARPFLSYFSPSEVSWFGLEHLNLGYSDYSLLPDLTDGVFAGLPYEEGKPGYQIERIPPYVSTFNPGLDSNLPVYKPLPMFEALKAALSQKEPIPSPWDHYTPQVMPVKPKFPESIYDEVYFVGNPNSVLAKKIGEIGVKLTEKGEKARFAILDGENITESELKQANSILMNIRKEGGFIWIMVAGKRLSPVLESFGPEKVELTDRTSSALQNGKMSEYARYFGLPDLYFSEAEGDPIIIKQGIDGDLKRKGTTVFEASNTDWTLFNGVGENRKCAQVVLYEHLQKPSGVALVTIPWEKSTFAFSTLDYRIESKAMIFFWRTILSAMGVRNLPKEAEPTKLNNKIHDLLLDGPVQK